MKHNLILLFVLLTATFAVNAQSDYLTIQEGIKLPKDSLECEKLIESLNGFLQDTTENNQWVFPNAKGETNILLDEQKHLVAEMAENGINTKPYLTNLIPIGKTDYMVQISFMGVVDEKPQLQGIFNFIATPTDSSFLFASPLFTKTKQWHCIKEGYLTAYYDDEDTKEYVIQYLNNIKKFDKMLEINFPTTAYFCKSCETMPDLLYLLGIEYSQAYSNKNWPMVDFVNTKQLFKFYPRRFFEGKTPDPHDVFHSRAYKSMSKKERNRYMICGCAYVYCGSWRISWEDIQKKFKAKMNYQHEKDWLKLYFERYNFGDSKARHLLVTQFVNALIIEKVIKEQGFSAVKKSLASGNIYKDQEHFFHILEEVTGINEKNFNKKVSKLIQQRMQEIE